MLVLIEASQINLGQYAWLQSTKGITWTLLNR
jgi:hypothetical protein